ncbi:hypothetical protein B0H15DRAFT_108337 [Mycena belliarum]|uniref:CCHC-type domain-containing protein n=1 Tax=Mycena belliarum TaxID=1033014 RepID=A0AAD6XXM1_9AGAR|nr:hypothetical protein B0H15DRAFT_108337 [Mycena belliae]
MAYQFISRKGCFKCGNRAFAFVFAVLPHIGRQLAILLRVVHRTSVFAIIADSLVTNHQHALLPAQFRLSSVIRAAASGTYKVRSFAMHSILSLTSCSGMPKPEDSAAGWCPEVLRESVEASVRRGVLRLAQNCGRYGHIARTCPGGSLGGPAFATRPPPPGRGLNTSTLPPVKCYRCGGPNHMARRVAAHRPCRYDQE